nr:hypothetical protein [Tanacetum cinerariifolium]
MTSITSLCEMACQVVQKKLEEKQLEEERAAKSKYWKLSVCYDDDDDEERSDSLDDNIISELPSFSAITPDEPVLSIEEPDNSLSMRDEHLDTIPVTESDEFIKSETVVVQKEMLKIRYLFLNPLKTMHGVRGVATWLMAQLVKDVLFYDRNLRKIWNHIPKISRILPSHPMLVPTLSMLLESHTLSNWTTGVS